jgi:hypothetical protein
MAERAPEFTPQTRNTARRGRLRVRGRTWSRGSAIVAIDASAHTSTAHLADGFPQAKRP